jgi:hypothetical protein
MEEGMKAVLLSLLLTAAPLLQAASTFFVTFPVQAPTGAAGQDAQAAMSAGVTLLRHQIPGEPAHQMAGPDGPGIGRIYTRPSLGSYVLTDAGSQWVSAVSQSQTVLGIVETYAPQFQWGGKAFVGAVQGSISKADIVAGRLSLDSVLMSEIPIPQLALADEERIQLSIPAFLDASGLATGLVLWRQEGSQAWQKWAYLPAGSVEQAYVDISVTARSMYRYGMSIRYPWPGGSGNGSLPEESGFFVTQARSESGLIQASLKQPTPTPYPTLGGAIPTPDLGAEPWIAYPNPSRDGKVRLAFHMVKKGSYHVSAYGLDGTLVHQFHGTADEVGWVKPVADLSRMASGVYLMRLSLRYDSDEVLNLPIRKLAIIR